MDDGEHRVDLEAKRRSRQRRLRRKKVRDALALALLAMLLAAFLFSPWGPGKGVFFGGGEAEENMEPQAEGAAEAHPEADVEGEGRTVEEAVAKGGREQEGARREKASDPGPPAVAIVVDDTGLDAKNLEQWLRIDAPITFAVLPHTSLSQELAEELYEAGFQIMLHIPTENEPPNSFSGLGQLSTGMGRQEVFSTLDGDLATVPHVEGINNHQGGKGCNDRELMTYMCEWARERGLFVVDSDSSTHSQVTAAATSLGFPRRRNQVFIDHQNEPEYIRAAMRRLANIAVQDGTAIGICHFHRPNTPSIVGEMVVQLRSEGIHFAFVQHLYH